MNPAPPVTSNILPSNFPCGRGNLCPSPGTGATWRRKRPEMAQDRVKIAAGQFAAPRANACPRRPKQASREQASPTNEQPFNPRRRAGPDRALCLDRRFRALPFGGEAVARGGARAAGGHSRQHAVCAACRLYAGHPQVDRLRSAARTHRAVAPTRARRAATCRALRPGPDDAAHLEIGAGTVSRGHSAAHRLCR